MTRYEATAMFEGEELTDPFEGATEQEAMDLAREEIDEMIRHKEEWVRTIIERDLPTNAVARHIAELKALQNCVYRVREVTYGEWR